jgi:uncharacterized protein
MTRADLVLAVLAAAFGRPYTPVQIQKAVFIICDQFPELIDEGPGFDFKPYDYGPFDSDVYSEIGALQRGGLAEISPSPFGSWNIYSVTEIGEERGGWLINQLEGDKQAYIYEISQWVRSLSFSKLVKSIYEAYPEMRANSIFRG